MEAKGLRIEELRATNYVRYFDGKEGEVSELGNFSYFSWIEEDWSGIPLTEEWLLKFGFIKDLEYDDTFNMVVSFRNGFTTISIDIKAEILLLDNMEIKMKYVHQLQNLFFSLTGEELTVSS